MKELVFLLEEASAKAMLESLLPRMLNSGISHRLIPFQGKQDLERQMVRRLKGYINPNARFIVLRDQDNAPDCMILKAQLVARCKQSGQLHRAVVRIACTELETYYLADLAAVEQALEVGNMVRYQRSAKFRNPDRLGNPSKELDSLTKGVYQKVSGSRAIGKHLDVDNVRSHSFRNLITAIRRMESELLAI
jgi:hypothetical protein